MRQTWSCATCDMTSNPFHPAASHGGRNTEIEGFTACATSDLASVSLPAILTQYTTPKTVGLGLLGCASTLPGIPNRANLVAKRTPQPPISRATSPSLHAWLSIRRAQRRVESVKNVHACVPWFSFLRLHRLAATSATLRWGGLARCCILCSRQHQHQHPPAGSKRLDVVASCQPVQTHEEKQRPGTFQVDVASPAINFRDSSG